MGPITVQLRMILYQAGLHQTPLKIIFEFLTRKLRRAKRLWSSLTVSSGNRKVTYIYAVLPYNLSSINPLDVLNFTLRIIIRTRSMDDVVKWGVSLSRLCFRHKIQRRSSLSYDNAEESGPISGQRSTAKHSLRHLTIRTNKARVQTLQPCTTDDLANLVPASSRI